VPTAFEILLSCPSCGKDCRAILSEETASGEAACQACGRTLYRIQSLDGYIYVLSNPRMAGIVKIGCTRRSVQARLEELNSATGVPAPFIVEACFAVFNPETAEANIHKKLSHRRVQGREFFEIELGEALRVVETTIGMPPVYLSESLRFRAQRGAWFCPKCAHVWDDLYSWNGKCPRCGGPPILQQ